MTTPTNQTQDDVVNGTQNESGNAQTDQNSLNIQDLQNLLAIVDFGAQNGLYKGWETISAVYALREKLYNFLKNVDPNLVAPKDDNQNNTQTENKSSEQNSENGTQKNRRKK